MPTAAARSAVTIAIGPTVAAMAAVASEPLSIARREKRAAMISPIVALPVGFRPSPAACSSRLVLKGARGLLGHRRATNAWIGMVSVQVDLGSQALT